MHHILSFNNLLTKHIPDIVGTYGHFITMVNGKKYSFNMSDVVCSPTKPSTGNCHDFGLNYLFCVTCTIEFKDEDDNLISSCRTPLAHIPLMTGRSVLCRGMDPDPEPFCGIFISKGKCRTIPPTKTVMYNTHLLSCKGNVHALQVRSSHTDKIFRSTSTIDILLSDIDTVSVRLPFQNTPIHIRIIVIALGETIDGFIEMISCIAGGHYDRSMFRPFEIAMKADHMDITTADQAIMFISNTFDKNIASTGTNILKNEMFPHINGTFKDKCSYLCMCTVRLLLYKFGICKSTSRDDYSVSQIVSSADHVGSMFRLLFIAHIRTCCKLLRRMIVKNPDTVRLPRVYGEPRLSSRILSAVASGAWSPVRKGVSINLNSSNHDAVESQLRRISSSLATTSGNHTVPRNVMSDQYGFICAASSPDGDATGLIYELALTATISQPVSTNAILEELIQLHLGTFLLPISDWCNRDRSECVDDYFYFDSRGAWNYCIVDPSAFITGFRRLRRAGIISPFAFIHCERDIRIIRVTFQAGILCRPLVIAGQQSRITPSMKMSWMLAQGIVEYISPSEQRTLCSIAVSIDTVTQRTTHIEITQASFLGVLASSVAFATGQQGPRLAYSTLQKKQIITGQKKRYRGAPDTGQLWNTHRPLVYSKTASMIPASSTICRGVPVVLAMMSLPQNQEDAIVMKRGTLERGAFTMSDSREYISETTTSSTTKSETFECPSVAVSKKTASYKYIGPNGLPTKGDVVPGGSVIIGKTRGMKRASISDIEETSDNIVKCDISTCSKSGQDGMITSVTETNLPTGKRVRVVVTTTRIPQVGDKFTSQYAQKGVVGAIWDDVDMPFSMTTGMSPDVIVSPLSMTSRMTMSSMLEALCGKVVSVTCKPELGIDEQEYNKSNTRLHEQLGKELVTHGFSSDGTERFIDGRTGTVVNARIFTGVVDYYRLVHIASKKIHARSTGPRDPLTRQPRDGRRFGGGLRIGEMESSALAAHGSSRVLQERFRELSDSFEIFVCAECQLICDDVCDEIDYFFCRQCQSNSRIRSVLVPFTFLVMSLELMSTGIHVKFDITDPE
jgi:DNA-directed RNA polymerase beta subunit